MEEIVLSDAIERYLNGEMGETERLHFENMRQDNADLDQLVVEHLFFLKQMETYNDHYRFKETLNGIHSEMANEVKLVPLTPKGGKLVQFWNRYRKTIAVAATIAGLISISVAGILLVYNQKDKVDYELLSKKIEKNQALVEKVDNKVNTLITKDAPRFQPKPNTRFGGTGFIIDPKGYMVTNAHVALKKNLYVFNEKVGSLKAELLYTDKENDLAILKIVDTNFKALRPIPYTLAKTEPELGQKIFTLGYPRPELIYYEGYISARSANGTLSNPNVFLLNLPVENGNSGSPVINQNGVITGIISSRELSQSGYAAAIKPRALNNLLEMLRTDEKTGYNMPSKSAIAGVERPIQVKRIQDYIFMIEVE
jgi:serine protease Do